jgi:Putative Actinobacterial Holin-X, holin superfamily III
MRSVSPTGSISSLIAALRALGERILTLVTLEGRQAGLSLAWMLGLALAAAVLAISGWLALLACAVLALVQNDIIGWGWALSSAALLSFALAGGLVYMVIQRSRHLLFPATRRQLSRIGGGGNRHE